MATFSGFKKRVWYTRLNAEAIVMDGVNGSMLLVCSRNRALNLPKHPYRMSTSLIQYFSR